ncbi:hypothetical protein V1478_007353 [Vespula squamosa]|uniref:Uncharacterized protein n=1 Tax=Vespula squamosa TaxID=30214 RepID=A0ABD2B301_VESSQ
MTNGNNLQGCVTPGRPVKFKIPRLDDDVGGSYIIKSDACKTTSGPCQRSILDGIGNCINKEQMK